MSYPPETRDHDQDRLVGPDDTTDEREDRDDEDAVAAEDTARVDSTDATTDDTTVYDDSAPPAAERDDADPAEDLDTDTDDDTDDTADEPVLDRTDADMDADRADTGTDRVDAETDDETARDTADDADAVVAEPVDAADAADAADATDVTDITDVTADETADREQDEDADEPGPVGVDEAPEDLADAARVTPAEPVDAAPVATGVATVPEPAGETAVEDIAASADTGDESGAGEPEPSGELMPGDVPATAVPAIWDDGAAEGFRVRWREVQLGFVDDPHGATDEAQALVDEVVDAVTSALAEQRADLDGWRSAEGASGDTEHLRMAIRRYRDFIDRLLSL